MKDNIPRFIPVWLIALLVLTFCFVQCGCRTGGVRLNPNSAGKVVQPNPRKRLPPPKLTQPITPLPPAPIVAPKSIPKAKTHAVESTPAPPEQPSVKANPVKANPKPAGELKSFTPTTSPVTPKLIEGDGGCVVIVDNETADTPQIVKPHEAAPKEEQANVNWLSLFAFYATCFLGLIILWVTYDIIKDAIEMKKQGSPIKKHLENLKKPAKGTRAARKPTKKKPTKKKLK